jgi:hypothetical protein
MQRIVVDALFDLERSDRFGRISGLVNVSRHALAYSETALAPALSVYRGKWRDELCLVPNAGRGDTGRPSRRSRAQIHQVPQIQRSKPNAQRPTSSAEAT